MSSELKAKVEEYLGKAGDMFENLEVRDAEFDMEEIKKEFREMALGYYRDAKHFHEKGEYINALAALEYAEGWLDAGKALGIFK
ncbi:MAG: DUF357 domain-containing protein [Candidatus Altiarchaeota archaeon]|nr:DUF357 domain-containing protein [Candidatus Altiarchaeota archaeon]